LLNDGSQSTKNITKHNKIPLFDARQITANAEFLNTSVMTHLSYNIR